MWSLRKLFSDNPTNRWLREIRPVVEEVSALEPQISALSDEALRAKTEEFKARLADGAMLDVLLPEAFAAVREASKRVLGQRHFDVQLMGGMVLHKGGVAEMRTGEGKTLVATLPAYLNALSGKGVHVITVNEYLARRDAVWMGQIYSFLGLSVGVINHDTSYLYDPSHREDSAEDEVRDELGSYKVQYDFLRPASRTEAYAADITYGTNSEFGFDYLRDNLEYEAGRLRQRGHAYAIVDEIDSILIDEARTPLIISAPAAESEQFYTQFARIAATMVRDEDFEVDEKHKAATLTEKGIEKAEAALGVGDIYTEKGIKYVHHLETAVRAKALFERDRDYVVRDGEVVIVDEFTGRLQPGRRWSDGLHQAIEAKEGVAIQRESRTMASITYQNYFRMYERLSGMTGTASTSTEEFYSVYGLTVVEVPTNRPVSRIDRDDLIFRTERGKFRALARKVKEVHEKGQPILIGTVSIEKNEALSAYLKSEGVPHEVLNAKNHEREGEIIAQAGREGAVTIATNMAGRGVDIKLGGNPAPEGVYEKVRDCGGLLVIGTERHEARRIDNQLRGRSGRQGDPGETQFYVSLDDTLMRVFAADTVKNMMARLNIPEDEPIQNKLITRSLESAQTKIEGLNFDRRKLVLAYDDVLNRQRQAIYRRRHHILTGGREAVDTYLAEIIGDDVGLKEAVARRQADLGEDAFMEAAKRLMLQAIDMHWLEHLEVMDYMRTSINLRAYGQRDPLIEYRKEALQLFKGLEGAIMATIADMLPKIGVPAPSATAPLVEAEKLTFSATTTGSTAPAAAAGRKIGRNETVTITNGSETKTMKYKKAEPLLKEGWKVVEEK